VTFVTSSDLGYLRSIELRLGRTLERTTSLPEFDYSGSSAAPSTPIAPKKGKSGGRMGSRSADALTEEELEALLNPKG